MPDRFNFPGMPSYPPELPETLREIVTKLHTYGFTLRKDSDIWVLIFPLGHWSGSAQAGFNKSDLASGLLSVLRTEEERNDVLHRYEQFDARWGKVVYGNSRSDTTIAQAGCGPT